MNNIGCQKYKYAKLYVCVVFLFGFVGSSGRDGVYVVDGGMNQRPRLMMMIDLKMVLHSFDPAFLHWKPRPINPAKYSLVDFVIS